MAAFLTQIYGILSIRVYGDRIGNLKKYFSRSCKIIHILEMKLSGHELVIKCSLNLAVTICDFVKGLNSKKFQCCSFLQSFQSQKLNKKYRRKKKETESKFCLSRWHATECWMSRICICVWCHSRQLSTNTHLKSSILR